MAEHKAAKESAAQPPVRRPGMAGRLEWTARARLPVADPRQYTRFVKIMKRVLLLAALALLVAVIVYSLQPRDKNRVAMTFEHMSKISNDLAMIKPRLSGTDASGNPFVVTADAAIQDGPSMRRTRLRNIQADITLKQGRWLSVSASNGVLDIDAKKLTLSGAIVVYSDDGYELHTSGLAADLGKGIVRGDTAVIGQGPLGALHADRFEIDRQGKRVRLMGHVKMTIYKNKVKHS